MDKLISLASLIDSRQKRTAGPASYEFQKCFSFFQNKKANAGSLGAKLMQMISVFDGQLLHTDTLKPNTRLLPANVANLKTLPTASPVLCVQRQTLYLLNSVRMLSLAFSSVHYYTGVQLHGNHVVFI